MSSEGDFLKPYKSDPNFYVTRGDRIKNGLYVVIPLIGFVLFVISLVLEVYVFSVEFATKISSSLTNRALDRISTQSLVLSGFVLTTISIVLTGLKINELEAIKTRLSTSIVRCSIGLIFLLVTLNAYSNLVSLLGWRSFAVSSSLFFWVISSYSVGLVWFVIFFSLIMKIGKEYEHR